MVNDVEGHFQAVIDTQFVEYVGQMMFDRVFAQVEVLGDLSVGRAFDHLTDNLEFTAGQPESFPR